MSRDGCIDPVQRVPGIHGRWPGIAAIVDAQAGCVSRRQLLACGISSSTVDRWRASSLLRPEFRGVFAVGHGALTTDGRRWAAVLAGGGGAHLSHGDAAAAWGLLPTTGSRFHVTVPRSGMRGGRSRRLHVHRADLAPYDVGVVGGLPVTSVERTIVDLAGEGKAARVEEAMDQAMTLGLLDDRALRFQLDRCRRGTRLTRTVMTDRHPDSHEVRSNWERTMLTIVAEAGLPRPSVNVPLTDLGYVPDLLWRERRVIVEWDSWAHHRHRAVFESDRRKTVDLQAAGYRVLRFTWRQVRDDREWVLDHVRRALLAPGMH